MKKPNLLVILIDDLRFDEFGAGGHPYMKTPHVDRIAHEGAMFTRAFHPTPICSPNRASILTGQYASRHGIIDNVARDAASMRLPNYHLVLQRLGYETAHIGKWHMGNEAAPRPGYDLWVSFKGHGRLVDPEFNEDGTAVQHRGYITDLLNERAVRFVEAKRDKPFALFLAHKAVHPDAVQAADGTLDLTSGGGYMVPARHADLYRGAVFPKRPNMLPPEEVVKQKPVWAEAFKLKATERSQATLRAIQAGTQEEIRLRAAMMASVDEGVGMIFDALARTRQLDDTFILFLGDNGYFFGEHALGPERRFAYEEGIRAPFILRYPRRAKAGSHDHGSRAHDRHRADAGGTGRGQAAGDDAGPLAPAALRRQARRLAEVLPVRVLQRERAAVARRHGLQGGADGPPQADPLGEPRRRHARRALRPRPRPVRAQEPDRRAARTRRCARSCAGSSRGWSPNRWAFNWAAADPRTRRGSRLT